MYDAARQLIIQLQKQIPELEQSSGWDAMVKDYPWYATAHLGRTIQAKDKHDFAPLAGLFVTQPLRLASILEPPSDYWESWLQEHLLVEDAGWPVNDHWQNKDSELGMEPVLENDSNWPEDETSDILQEDNNAENQRDSFVEADEPLVEEIFSANLEDIDALEPEVSETPEAEIISSEPESYSPETNPGSVNEIPELTTAADIASEPSLVPDSQPEAESTPEIIEPLAQAQDEVVEVAKAGTPADEAEDLQEPALPSASRHHALEAAVAAMQSAPSDEDFLFEPFHTVDYFASQGVQIPAELIADVSPQQLDTKLKSFTQWLKVMKKLNYVPPVAKESDPEVDAQAIASLNMKTIVTEAMAEVLIKQGKKDQAGHIYTKLMLLHPEKSTYFAARLNELKNK